LTSKIVGTGADLTKLRPIRAAVADHAERDGSSVTRQTIRPLAPDE
jgi:hypothetical protein